MVAAVDEIEDYTAVFTRRERIDGELNPLETAFVKQSRPLDCIYMKWIAEPHAGRETIWCRNRYEGKIQAHEGSGIASWLGRLSLDPTGAVAMRGNRHAVTEAGIHHLAEAIRGGIDAQGVTVENVRAETVHDQASRCLLASGPFGEASRIEACVHEKSNLPTRMSAWNAQGDLLEEYTYRDYRVNGGIGERDFDVENPDYDF